MICNKCRVEECILNYSLCKICKSSSTKDTSRTKDGIVTTIYKGQKQSSKKRGHRPPEYSKKVLREWLFSQVIFHELYNEWVQSGYMRRLKPSVDRKEDSVHYCMSNIQLMTSGDNNGKRYVSVTVIHRTLGILGVFNSISKASIYLGFIGKSGSVRNAINNGKYGTKGKLKDIKIIKGGQNG